MTDRLQEARPPIEWLKPDHWENYCNACHSKNPENKLRINPSGNTSQVIILCNSCRAILSAPTDEEGE